MSAHPPSPPLQNPIPGTTLDTSPETLGLTPIEDASRASAQPAAPPSRRSSASKNVLKRTVENTAAKLGGSAFLGNSRRESSGTPVANRLSASFSATPKRFLSLSRKGKGKEQGSTSGKDISGIIDDMGNVSVQPSTSSRPGSPTAREATQLSTSPSDSPFIRPPSPSPPSTPLSRPSIDALRGFGSLRAGTQTLIQAIQAVPWADEPDGDDEAIPPMSVNSDSSEEDQSGAPLASSIHTIHRPIARSRRQDTPVSSSAQWSKGGASYFPAIPSSEEEEGPLSEDDDDDFESTPVESRILQPVDYAIDEDGGKKKTPEKIDPLAHVRRMQMTRSASLATVRLKRRAKLADKLKEVFGLPDLHEVLAELPCWLLRSVLLQGYMYLTNSHLCFFAHLPSREDQVLKSGSLNKKTQRTKRWVKHWFVLKNDVLSWYQSSSDPYFPHGVVDLRYAISCEPVQERGFRIKTNQKVVQLMADSVPSREEWVKAIRKVIFKAQNMGDSVKIAIPYSVVMDVDKSSAMDFSETIEVKVLDNEDKVGLDSYFFAYFHNISAALDQIREAVKAYKPIAVSPSALEQVQDTTGVKLVSHPNPAIERTPSEPIKSTGYGLRLPSLFRPFASENPIPASHQSGQAQGKTSGEFTHVLRPSTQTVASPLATTPNATPRLSHVSTLDSTARQSRVLTESVLEGVKVSDFHTYPPSPSPSTELAPLPTRDSANSSSWGVPSWLRGSTRRVFSVSSSSSDSTIGRRGVSEVLSADEGDVSADLGFSVLETHEAAEPEAAEKFRTTFAFDDKEPLLGYFPGYLFRLLPTYGKLYISNNFFCFKSSGPLATRTRMVLPIRDILTLEKSKAYRFGHHGLVVIIKGHEELFFEFGSSDRRSAFYDLLNRQMEDSRRRAQSGDTQALLGRKQDHVILEELESASLFGEDDPRPPPESLADSLPAVMFTSTSSTFLTFKPQRPLHFTCLTIGTRGDVQPYIALAKGLIADGHKVRIATHGEFKEWIESHGIEFGYVGGDPAELMRICVENGMFTVSFLREGVQKFRGWIDDLLKTSWEACQGTDVLIESPSAMGGIHIAEALRIPYYRAFTMTWTRTRAYPHAFAVPEHKMGGGYNYMSYVMFDQVFWRATAGQINRWRRNTLKLQSTNLDKLEPHKVPFLYNFSPTAVPPPLDWPEWIRVTGYWFLDDADVAAQKWAPPQDLIDFIDKAHQTGKKIVYVGFGSIVVSDPDAMTRCVVEAIEKSGVYAILSKGWSDRLQVKKGVDVSQPEIPLPPSIYPLKSVPHDWLFKRIEAACHHGGAGTTGASLRAGIPTIIKPFFGDQYFWGDRVEALGVGSCVRKLTVDALTEAFITATTDEKQIEKARHIGEQIRSENGVATAIESIYRDLEYARTLIKAIRPAANSDDDDNVLVENQHPPTSSQSTPDRSSRGSWHEASQAASDWSIVSDSEDRKPSRKNSTKEREASPTSKRSSLAAAVLSVLPDALAPGSLKK